MEHYEVLGLPSGEEGFRLSEAEIRRAYKRKAIELHPDKRPDDENAHRKFQKLQSSYQVLKDDESRRLYDDLLRVQITMSSQQPEPADEHEHEEASSNEEEELVGYSFYCEPFIPDMGGDYYGPVSTEEDDVMSLYGMFGTWFDDGDDDGESSSSYYKKPVMPWEHYGPILTEENDVQNCQVEEGSYKRYMQQLDEDLERLTQASRQIRARRGEEQVQY